MKKRIIKFFLFVAIFFWLFKDINYHQLFIALQNLQLQGIFLTTIMIFCTDLLIAYRWYYLSKHKFSYISSLEATMLAFFLNIFAPAKLGDLAKVYYMHKKDNIDPHYSSSIFFIERFFDVIVLTIIIAFSALFIYPNFKTFLISIILFSFILFVFFIIFYKKTFFVIIRFIKIKKVRKIFFLIVKAIRENLTKKRITITFLLTFLVWCCNYLNNIIFFFSATTFQLHFIDIFIASTLAFAISAIPLTPGGIGTFQGAFIVALGWYGISKEEALGASSILQLLYILPATFYSLYLFFSKDFLWEKKDVSTQDIQK